MAPGANLLLILANSLYNSDTDAALTVANSTAGVSVVSMSYGQNDYSGETGEDSYYKTAGITYLASTADSGAASTAYPATSPYVVGVGGTSIVTADASGSYGSESVWNDSATQTTKANGATGGGISVG